MRNGSALIAAMLAAAGSVLGGGAASAAPATVACGSSLAVDSVLTRDLSCPYGEGIYLEIDVTLDLRGHKLIGPGADATVGHGIGVTLSPAWPSRVVNGTITGWPVAIGGNEDFETVESATLQNLRLVGNGTAILANQAALTLDGLTVRGNEVGLQARSWGERGTEFTLTGSAFRDNGVAVEVDARTRATLSGNIFRGNGTGYTVAPGEVDGYAVTLQGNRFVANGDGIDVTVPGTSLGGNTALRNTGWGIHAPGAVDLGGNAARRNGNRPQCVGVAC